MNPVEQLINSSVAIVHGVEPVEACIQELEESAAFLGLTTVAEKAESCKGLGNSKAISLAHEVLEKYQGDGIVPFKEIYQLAKSFLSGHTDFANSLLLIFQYSRKLELSEISDGLWAVADDYDELLSCLKRL